MKSVAFILLLAAAGTLTIASCEKVTGEGPVVSETRSVSGFKKVSVSISGKVNYTISPDYKVEVHAQRNILDILETNKTGDELVIKIKDGKRVRSHEDIFIDIYAPFAEGINLNGSGEVNLTNNVTAQSMNLRISGSGNIFLSEINLAGQLAATISGSGDILINNGAAKNEDLKISGSGNIRIANVQAEKAVTTISGSGDIELKATQTLDATISGSGSVYYLGNPVLSTHISGSGKVKPF